MRQVLLCVTAVLVLSAGNCAVASLHPIASETDLFRDSSLVGLFADSRDTVSVTIAPDDTYRAVSWRDSESVQHTVFMLTRIGGKEFIGAFPDDPYARHFDLMMSLHAIVRVERTRPLLVFRIMDGDSLQAYRTKHSGSVAVIPLDENFLLFTDSTSVLRTFLEKHKDDAHLWARDSTVLRYVGPPRDAPTRH